MFDRTRPWLFVGVLAIACGNTSDEDEPGGQNPGGSGGTAGTDGGTAGSGATPQTGGSSGAAGSSGSVSPGGSAGSGGSDSDAGNDANLDSPTAGPCAEVTFDLHSSPQVYVVLEDMQAHSTPPEAYSFVMQKLHPAPIVYLGPGVQAINLGPDPDFDGTDTAPDSGYASDDPEPIIGREYKSGGSGSTGFDMSGNVFVLLHPDGAYAKVSWTSAVAGVVTVDAYYSMTADLTCTR